MERRDFFKFGARKTAKAIYDVASDRAIERASNWFRPPFAVSEMDFLIDCTKCDLCINACDYGVLFRLPERYGTQAAGTPAMDLLKKGCHLCIDWPCVTVCEAGVLALPIEENTDQDAEGQKDTNDVEALPKLATAYVLKDTCLPYAGPECGACQSSCPVPGALKWEDLIKPVIDPALCTGCALCRETCITTPKSIAINVIKPLSPVPSTDAS